jgi:hypothetical protein
MGSFLKSEMVQYSPMTLYKYCSLFLLSLTNPTSNSSQGERPKQFIKRAARGDDPGALHTRRRSGEAAAARRQQVDANARMPRVR